VGVSVKGEVVIVPFPFSDLSQIKKRPALVVAELKGDDRILCQITSRSYDDPYSIPLVNTDFQVGGLKMSSWVRPNKIFTFESSLIERSVGRLNDQKMNEIIEALIKIMSQ
jgi:mRNA interferase MazF